MVVSTVQMQRLEEEAFARGVLAADLMDEAGAGIAAVIQQFFPIPGTLVLALGKGNNAGDALVAARCLLGQGWELVARYAYGSEAFKELPLRHWAGLKPHLRAVGNLRELRDVPGSIVTLDGLVGIGGKGELRGELARVVDEINTLRSQRHACTVALDLPSGLGEDGRPGTACVQADITVAIAHVKTALLADVAINHVGRLAVAPLRALGSFDEVQDEPERLLSARNLLPRLPCRDFDFHKGRAGRVGIVAGSRGTVGAAVLCARGVLHAGAGLVTLYAREDIYPLLAQTAPAEVMVRPVKDYREVLQFSHDALAIGPGLGTVHAEEILALLEQTKTPVVLDADGLNIVAERGLQILEQVQAPLLLTPHPGEMGRLLAADPSWSQLPRAELARKFVARLPRCTLLLKGARTVIASRNQPLAFNATGHPGMASGGMGDVLTGVCAALIGQGLPPYDAACLGAWLSGRAAELALLPEKGNDSQESFSASGITAMLGRAFTSLKHLDF